MLVILVGSGTGDVGVCYQLNNWYSIISGTLIPAKMYFYFSFSCSMLFPCKSRFFYCKSHVVAQPL